MMVKVFKFGENNKVEFTQKELENLLNEVYNNGYRDGRNSKDYTWTSPSWTCLNGTPRYADDKTIVTTCKDNNTTLSGQMCFDDTNSNINTTATDIGYGLDAKKLSCDALNDM